MDNTVGCKNIKGNYTSSSSRGLHLDVVVPRHSDLLPPGGLHISGTDRDVLGFQGGPGNDMSEENCGESILVGQKSVQGALGNLDKGLVGRCKHCEGPLAGKSVYQAGCFDCCKQGRELWSGDGKLCNVLGGGSRSWGKAGEGDDGGLLHDASSEGFS